TGWVLGFDEQTLQPVKVFNTSANSGGNGMWQSGGAVSADAQGNLYFALGNGFSTNGPISGVTIVNPRSGYTSPPTGTISGGHGRRHHSRRHGNRSDHHQRRLQL